MRKCDFELRIVKIVQEFRLWKNVAGILQRRNSLGVCKCKCGEGLREGAHPSQRLLGFSLPKLSCNLSSSVLLANGMSVCGADVLENNQKVRHYKDENWRFETSDVMWTQESLLHKLMSSSCTFSAIIQAPRGCGSSIFELPFRSSVKIVLYRNGYGRMFTCILQSNISLGLPLQMRWRPS